jgi:hypothetical protein
MASSMLILRARHACLNFRCTPLGTLRMSMLPMLSTVAHAAEDVKRRVAGLLLC